MSVKGERGKGKCVVVMYSKIEGERKELAVIMEFTTEEISFKKHATY